MQNLDIIAKELFNKVRGRFPTVTIGDGEGNVTNEPEQARYFDFDFVTEGRPIGKVSISLDEKQLSVVYGKDLVTNEDAITKDNWYDFLKELRQFAKKRLLTFDTRDITKSNLNSRDYKFLSTNRSGEEQMSESKLYGTSKTSYQDVGAARLMFKHSAPINPEIPAGRTQHINSIYIESAEGERFKYPFRHIAGARAMARHVAEGGKPFDDFGSHITGLSEELYKLRKFKNYMNRSSVMAESLADYMDIVNERIQSVKKTIERIQKPAAYKEAFEGFEKPVFEEVPEDVRENWIDELTIKQFNEELKGVFPYIYKLVSEANAVQELGPDDLIAEEDEDKADEIRKSFFGEPGRAGQGKIGAFLQKLFTPKYTRKEAFGSRQMIFNRLQKAGYNEADAKEILGMYSRAIQVANKKITGEDPTRFNDNASGWILNFSNADEVLEMAYKIFMSQLKKSNLEPGKVSHPTYGRTHESDIEEVELDEQNKDLDDDRKAYRDWVLGQLEMLEKRGASAVEFSKWAFDLGKEAHRHGLNTMYDPFVGVNNDLSDDWLEGGDYQSWSGEPKASSLARKPWISSKTNEEQVKESVMMTEEELELEQAFEDIMGQFAEGVCEDCGNPSWRTLDEEKKKGVDGKACWKGYRYAGREKKADGTYKDKCVKVEGVDMLDLDTYFEGRGDAPQGDRVTTDENPLISSYDDEFKPGKPGISGHMNLKTYMNIIGISEKYQDMLAKAVLDAGVGEKVSVPDEAKADYDAEREEENLKPRALWIELSQHHEKEKESDAQSEGNAFAHAVRKAKMDGKKKGDEIDGPDGEKIKLEKEEKTPLGEFILSYYDREAGEFPKGETAVLTMIEKDYGEEFIEPAKQFIERVYQVTEQFREPEVSPEMARMRELAGLR